MSLAEGVVLLAGGLIMVFFGLPARSSKDWLWMGISALIVALGAVVTVKSWQQLWASRSR